MISQLKIAMILKLCGSLMCLLFDMLYVVVCTTRHWPTSGRLIQELNAVCILDASERKLAKS